MHPTLQQRLMDDPYQGYAYAYPHKTAYRHFPSPLPLGDVWKEEQKDALFLYLHLPFCEMRCGFCNLFTTTNPVDGLVGDYLSALELQTECTAAALGPHCFERGALGGGTPTFLSVPELERVFAFIQRTFVLAPGMPLSCELSPATSTPEKISLLKANGVTRASIGVQSFVESETRTLGRPQKIDVVHEALGRLKDAGFPVLNIDLIYGMAGQTVLSWLSSLREALQYSPGEIFLYPLYVRPLTGLDRIGRNPSDNRQSLYRAGRELLLAEGYEQVSMRLFRRTDCADGGDLGGAYCCQEDGMVGLGAGARSYTRSVHYCTEYAVGRPGILDIIRDYSRRGVQEHSAAVYGCILADAEQRRRFVIKSLLRAQGLSQSHYRQCFGSDCGADFPELAELQQAGLVLNTGDFHRLTAAGFERSDTIGPWLYSPAIASEMRGYEFA